MKNESFDLSIRNETAGRKVSNTRVKKQIETMLKTLRIRKGALTISLVSDKAIARLNWKYLRHRGPTDVLSFSNRDGLRLKTVPPASPYLGDIVISLETTRRQAEEYGNSLDYELAFYLCHGILHLMGWKDKTRQQRMRMWKKQEAILARIGLTK